MRGMRHILLPAIALFFACASPALADDFSCNSGQASGTLYDSSENCPTTLTTDHVFSFLVCNMEKLSSDIMGSMYCGIVYNLAPGVIAAMTLAVIFAGLGFVTGVSQMPAREFQLFLLKIGLVSAFATQSDYMVGVAYNLLVNGEKEGIGVALSALNPNGDGYTSGTDLYKYLDTFLGKALGFASSMVGADWDSQDTSSICKNAVFDVIVLMAAIFPPMFYIALIIIGQIAITFFRAVFGYIFSLVGLTFLITLSPFFLSFALFKVTRPFFDKYLAYLVSFSLQMVIVFAFLAFVVSIKVDNMASSFQNIIVPKKETEETTSFRFPWQYCTVCNFEVVDANGAEQQPDQYGKFISGGKLQCKTNDPTTVFVTTAPGTAQGAQDSKALNNALLQFTSTALLSLFVLAYIVNYVLRYVPAMGQFLASSMTGGTYVPQLAGGTTMGGIRPVLNMPGTSLINRIEHGFSDGYVANGWKGGTPGAIAAGIKEAGARLVGGSRKSEIVNRFSGNTDDPSIPESFAAWFINPNPEMPDQ